MAKVRRPAGAVAALLGLLVLSIPSGHAAREGDPAPAFELPNTMEELVRLDDYAGAPLVLVFYRGFF